MVDIMNNEDQMVEDTQYGRFLTFTLDENVYGISIKYVTEIIGMQTITPVPETPDFLKGIINLRGKVVPLIDVRIKFGKPEIEYNERTCVIVVEVEGLSVGLIVDMVDDVLSIPDEKIAPPPIGTGGYDNKYIEGIGKTEDNVILLLDAERILKSDEIVMMEEVSASGEKTD